MIDDDPLDLRIARRCHARSGIERPLCTFEEADDLFAYLDAADRGEAPPPSLLLVDIRMPVISGFEVVERVRARGAAALPPIAMFTTSDLDSDKQTAGALGCSAYLVKPPSTAQFIALFKALGP